ncbi:MAG: hypothetical protein FVQ79_14325, partial [Planctomycetes bacterium]|nr:hypothetical protein [Planctomycetota bacterium]
MPETYEQKRLKFWHVLLGIFILIIATWAVYYMRAKANFEAACEKIRAEGHPITMAELNKWYSIPPGQQNAADAILQAVDHLVEWEEEKQDDLPVLGMEYFEIDEPFYLETLLLSEQFLADNEKALTLLHKAAKIKYSRYPIDFKVGSDFSIDHLGPLKKTVQLLSLEARLYAEKNQPDKAIETIETMVAISHSLSNEPILISQLVCIACDGLTVATAQRVISRCDLSDTQLQRVADMIKKMQTHSMATGFIGERCFTASMFDDGTYRVYAIGYFWFDAVLVAAKVTGFAYNDTVFNIDLLT